MEKLEITKNYTVKIPEGVKVFGFGKTPKTCAAEDDDLISIVAMLKYRHPKIEDVLFHIPNESVMPVQGRVKAKKKGLKSGAPDLLIMTNPVVAVELKRENYKSSLPNAKTKAHFEDQVRILGRMANSGHTSVIAFGYKGFVEFYNSELKYILTDNDI